jgi:uncharacterized protein (DUF433 family)
MTLPKPFDRITIEADKMGGKPCIRGYRFTVQNLLGYLGTYPDRADLFDAFPFLEEEDIQQALGFAAEMLDPTWMPLDIAS